MRVGLLAFPPPARWPELDGAVPGWSAAGAGHVRGRDEQGRAEEHDGLGATTAHALNVASRS